MARVHGQIRSPAWLPPPPLDELALALAADQLAEVMAKVDFTRMLVAVKAGDHDPAHLRMIGDEVTRRLGRTVIVLPARSVTSASRTSASLRSASADGQPEGKHT